MAHISSLERKNLLLNSNNLEDYLEKFFDSYSVKDEVVHKLWLLLNFLKVLS